MDYRPPWQQVGGNAAEVYERQLVPVMLAPWAPKLIDLAEVGPGMQVLDVACGTGVVTRLAAERGRAAPGGWWGSISMSAMLSVARRFAPVGGATLSGWKRARWRSPCRMRLSTSYFASTVSSNFRIGQPRCVRCVVFWCPADDWESVSGAGSRGAYGMTPWRRPWSDTWAPRRRRTINTICARRSVQLRALVEEAGFRDVNVRTMADTARFPSRSRWLPINSLPRRCRRSAR